MDIDEYRRLSKSKFRFIDGAPHKSCPQCSLEAGDFVFHPSSEYGFREMAGGKKMQSWCPKCRAAKLRRMRQERKKQKESSK